MFQREANKTNLLKAKIKIAAACQKATKQCLGSSNHDGYTKMLLQGDAYKRRSDVRHMHLAYGFLRGKSYDALENTCHSSPDFTKVQGMVEKYGVRINWRLPYTQGKDLYDTGKKEQEDRFASWVEDAKLHLEGQKTT